MNMLEINNVTKSFGSNVIVDDISFSVPEGSVFGFIGQNGAGKTTTMKMILGLLTIDKGEIYVAGKKVSYGQNETNKYIGYLPDVPEFYGYMKPKEYLKLCGEITGMPKADMNERINKLLEMVGLAGVNKRIKGFSRGMKQRLGIAQALLNSPKLLICDEPTSALDPVGRKELLDILSEVKKETTVIFSTHILSDVEKICDNIAFLHNKKIVLNGSLDKIKKLRKGSGVEIEFVNIEDKERFLKIYKDGIDRENVGKSETSRDKAMEAMSNSKVHLDNKSDEDIVKIMKILADNQMPILRLERMEPNLEEMFMEVAGV